MNEKRIYCDYCGYCNYYDDFIHEKFNLNFCCKKCKDFFYIERAEKY